MNMVRHHYIYRHFNIVTNLPGCFKLIFDKLSQFTQEHFAIANFSKKTLFILCAYSNEKVAGIIIKESCPG